MISYPTKVKISNTIMFVVFSAIYGVLPGGLILIASREIDAAIVLGFAAGVIILHFVSRSEDRRRNDRSSR